MALGLAIIVLFVLIVWCVLQLCVLYSDCSLVLVASVFKGFVFPDVVVVFDWIANVFLNIVLLVSSLVLIYSYAYIGKSWVTKKFIAVLLLFIISMVVLSVSGDVFWIIVGWDGLGVSSFCLIIFYQNWKSIEGGLVTFMCNRFGDLFILMSMAFIMCDGLWLSVSSLSLCDWEVYMLMVIGGMTKSAQVPFSAWLPLAMAAPTPVSSLVHSSTLVTAGVFLMCRFNCVLSQECLSVVYMVSGFTILLAGVSSLFEWDLKKVVALSTLVHIGLMVNVASLGSVEPCIIHMTIHAFFKSMLFIGAGVIIHGSFNWQDLRRVSLKTTDVNWPIVWVSLLSIAGAPFLSGFCSNEVILGYYLPEASVLISLPFWLGVIFTVAYSFRIIFYLLNADFAPMVESGFVFCNTVMLCGVMLSAAGVGMVWEISWSSCFVVSFIELGSKIVLVVVIATGMAMGLLAVSMTNLVSLFNNMWNSPSFVGIWSMPFYYSSWLMLNCFDTNGSFGWLVANLCKTVLVGMELVKHYLLSWPVFLLKIFLTILTTLVILGGLGSYG